MATRDEDEVLDEIEDEDSDNDAEFATLEDIEALVETLGGLGEQLESVERRVQGLDRGVTNFMAGSIRLFSLFSVVVDPTKSPEERTKAMQQVTRIVEHLNKA